MGFDRVNLHRPTQYTKMPLLKLHVIGTRATARQGLTLVHFSAQRKRCLWDKGCFREGSGGIFWGGVEGLFRRLGDVLNFRNGSG